MCGPEKEIIGTISVFDRNWRENKAIKAAIYYLDTIQQSKDDGRCAGGKNTTIK